mmetsp:Transcript_61052/g.176869  ORF Transcript_61052/g.176869 Transcript_61052/m.176869 type:complete len:208 (+) Transcript_61052:54-677(+)
MEWLRWGLQGSRTRHERERESNGRRQRRRGAKGKEPLRAAGRGRPANARVRLRGDRQCRAAALVRSLRGDLLRELADDIPRRMVLAHVEVRAADVATRTAQFRGAVPDQGGVVAGVHAEILHLAEGTGQLDLVIPSLSRVAPVGEAAHRQILTVTRAGRVFPLSVGGPRRCAGLNVGVPSQGRHIMHAAVEVVHIEHLILLGLGKRP